MTGDRLATISALRRWYETWGRHDLPWRRTRDPYAVLVSEVMLQQTQVERVIPYYERWLSRWPTVQDLAEAPLADVIREWSGLGYNRRAVHLHRAAKSVMLHHGGKVPVRPEELRLLPGIGPYTAGAVACFAGEERVAVADTNIARVVARAFLGLENQREAKPAEITRAATELLPADAVRDHSLALMDLGAMVCGSRQPACAACPLEATCAWRAKGMPWEKASRRSLPRFEDTARFARGRIVDALREHSCLTSLQLAALLPAGHRDDLARYLFALEADGLLEQEDGHWRLAGQGNSNIASPKL